MSTTPSTGATAATPEEKAAVHEQLERLLKDSYFSHSRRFPSFLRYVVEKTLSGQEDALKERTLGIEIFGRPANYDTATDPIVRVTAAEIRKKLAQYYQEPQHEGELRINLPAGSYVPQFQERTVDPAPLTVPAPVPPPPQTPKTVKPPLLQRHFWYGFVVSCLVLAVVGGGALLTWQRQQRASFNFFWGPVFASGDPLLFCIADQQQYSNIALRDANDPSKQVILPDSLTAVVIDDLDAIVNIARVLQVHGKKYNLRGESATTLTDLRAGPTILVGAFDNAWTLRLTRSLRYHFVNNDGMTQLGIADSKAPNATRWMVDRQQQMATNNYSDYAIVARFTNTTTGEPTVVAAGVSRGGTIVAGEFLSDPNSLAWLMHAAAAAGNKKNMEIVLSTQIIGGEPGSPKIEATYFW